MLLFMGVLMGQAEIADRLGISRQRVQQLISRPGWPKPYATLAMGKVWLTKDIEEWITENRKDLGPPEPTEKTGPIGRRHRRRPAEPDGKKNGDH